MKEPAAEKADDSKLTVAGFFYLAAGALELKKCWKFREKWLTKR